VAKLERLLNLTAALLNTSRPLGIDDIWERVPGYPENRASFRRAFERDKDDLRDMGIPIRLEPLPHTQPPAEGYRIPPEEYYLDDPGFEADELAALHLAASMFRLDGAVSDRAMWKLGVTPDESGAPDEFATLPTDPNLAPLFEAVNRHRTVGFSYRGEDRTMDPLRLDFRRGRWYVTGFDHDRDAERNFRLDRISGTVSLGESAPDRGREDQDRPFEPWRFGDEERVDAKVLVDAGHAQEAASQVSSDAVAWNSDGSAVLTLAVTNTDAFRSFVLSFLEHAEVLAPPELRSGVIEWLEEIRA